MRLRGAKWVFLNIRRMPSDLALRDLKQGCQSLRWHTVCS